MIKSRLAFSSTILGIITLFLLLILLFFNDFIETYLTYRMDDLYISIGGFLIIIFIFISWLLTILFGVISYLSLKRNNKLKDIKYSFIGIGLAIISLIIYILAILLKL